MHRLALGCMIGGVLLAAHAGSAAAKEKPRSVHDFKVKDIDGKPVDLSSFRGRVLMVVNVASL